MKCSASVLTARYRPRSRSEGKPKITPSRAPVAAEAGKVSQIDAPTSLTRMPVQNAPAAISPACPKEIWPANPVSNIKATAPTTASKVWLARSRTKALATHGRASRAQPNSTQTTRWKRVSMRRVSWL